MSDKGLMTVQEAAKYLRMSEGWLYSSGIPHVKLGRRRLYRREDLDAHASRRVRR